MDQVLFKANREKYVVPSRFWQIACSDLFLCSYFHSDISNTWCALLEGAITKRDSSFSMKLIINKHFNSKRMNIKHIKTQSLGVGRAFLNKICKKLLTTKENICNLGHIKIKHWIETSKGGGGFKWPVSVWKVLNFIRHQGNKWQLQGDTSTPPSEWLKPKRQTTRPVDEDEKPP